MKRRAASIPKNIKTGWAEVQGIDPDNLTEQEKANMRDDFNARLGTALGELESSGVLMPVSPWDAKRIEPHSFVSVYQHEMESIAGEKALPPVARVFLAALARSHENGHAPFASKELAEVTGLRAKDTLPRAIETATATGLLAPESTGQCLVVGRLRRPLSGRQAGAPRCEHRPAQGGPNRGT